MATDVKVPAMGESVTTAILLKWHKQDGDRVEVDDALAEMETDKANVDVPASAAGVVRHVKKAGETVGVGDVIARIEGGAGAAGNSSKAQPSPMPVTRPPDKATGIPSPAASSSQPTAQPSDVDMTPKAGTAE